MKLKLTLILVACVLLLTPGLLSNTAHAQGEQRIKDYNNNGWYMYIGDHKVSDKWGIHAEAQLRRYNIIKDPQQLLLRTGVNYDIKPTAMFTVGYAFIETHPYGDYPAAGIFPEHRPYQQLQLKGSLGRLGLTHRYRLEQRWIKPAGSSDYTYLNRARYFLKATLPLAGPTLEEKEPFLAVYDEVLIGFGENVRKNIFDQNRLYGAIGYKINNTISLELGYLNQIIQKASGEVFEHNHTLQVTLFHNLNFARQE